MTAAAPDPTQAELMAALLMNAPPERQQQLIDAIWDRACGLRWWAGEGRKPGGREMGGRQRRVRLTDLDSGEELEGWVYEVPGDPASQKLLVEHGIGRPAVRETAKVDPVIQLVHRVPGKRDWKSPAPAEEAAAAAEPDVLRSGSSGSSDVPGVLMIGGQALGFGAVFAEPEDEPGEEGE